MMKSLWLMYHDVYENTIAPDIPRSASMYHIRRDRFKQHLSAILDSRLSVSTVGEFLERKHQESVILTFDDGWGGAFTTALPLLQASGLRATYFITRDFVGRKGFCDRKMIVDASQAGMEIGVHGTTHLVLSQCSREEIVQEFSDCKNFLESLLGKPVNIASLPGGDSNSLIAACATEAGLKALCSSRPTVNCENSTPFKLGRVPIRDTTGATDILRYCGFNLRKEIWRWRLFQLPVRLLGMKTYSYLRRRALGDRVGNELFRLSIGLFLVRSKASTVDHLIKVLSGLEA